MVTSVSSGLIGGVLKGLVSVANLGVSDSDGADARRIRALNLTAFVAFGFSTGWSLVWVVVAVVESYAPLVPVIVTNLIGSFAYALVLYLNSRHEHAAATWLLVLGSALSVGFAGIYFGLEGGVWLYLLLLPALAALFLRTDRKAELVAVIGGGSLLFAVVAAVAGDVPEVIADTALLSILFFVSAFGTALTAALLAFYYRMLADRAEARSDTLLLNILPAHIADRLKKGEYPIADRIPEVSVIFADIVGSTRLADRLTAEEMVDLLDGLFSAFDRIIDNHGLEKIKTTGDAYVAVAGLEPGALDHPQAAATTALQLRDELQHHVIPGSGAIEMRFGIHLGAVVAGVIGERKFSYDVWGDTMNIGSRMESTSLPNMIQTSQAFRDRVDHGFVFESRGPIGIKGKGDMETYFLLDEAASAEQRL